VAADIFIGFVFVVGGACGIIFRKPFLRLAKQVSSTWNPRLRPTERFIEVQHIVASVCFIATGGLVIIAALV